ncbi:hypothetical protein HZS_5584 [Henneguya salminicola]|nr:hypothetical protein HZS_5584 [Henneguya salminicola]
MYPYLHLFQYHWKDVNWGHLIATGFQTKIKYCAYYSIVRLQQGILSELGFQIGSIIAVIIIHVCLFIKLRKHFDLLEQEELKRVQKSDNVIRNYEKKQKRLKLEGRLAVMTLLIALSYIVFVFPIVVLDLIAMFDLSLNSVSTTIIVPTYVLDISIILVLVYPGVESLLFLYLNKPVWKSIKSSFTVGLPSIVSGSFFSSLDFKFIRATQIIYPTI